MIRNVSLVFTNESVQNRGREEWERGEGREGKVR
jgi:hypothetical protein